MGCWDLDMNVSIVALRIDAPYRCITRITARFTVSVLFLRFLFSHWTRTPNIDVAPLMLCWGKEIFHKWGCCVPRDHTQPVVIWSHDRNHPRPLISPAAHSGAHVQIVILLVAQQVKMKTQYVTMPPKSHVLRVGKRQGLSACP